MTFLGLETRNDLPKVSYMTALDYFVAINFAFLFASFIEFAIVHWYTKIGTGDYFIPPPDVMKKIALAHAENFNWFSDKIGLPVSSAAAAAVLVSDVVSMDQEDSLNADAETDRDEQEDPVSRNDCAMIVPASDHCQKKEKKEERIHANHNPNLLFPHHPADLPPATHVSAVVPASLSREEHQVLLLRQLNQEISDVQNILSSVSNPLPSYSDPSSTNFLTATTTAAAAATASPLNCQGDALLQLSSDYRHGQQQHHQLSAPGTTAAAAACRYLPTAYATLYGQLDTSIYPHNRKQHQLKQKQGKGKKNEPESGQEHYHEQEQLMKDKNKRKKKSASDATRQLDPMPMPSLLIQDGFREEDFCPVHVSLSLSLSSLSSLFSCLLIAEVLWMQKKENEILRTVAQKEFLASSAGSLILLSGVILLLRLLLSLFVVATHVFSFRLPCHVPSSLIFDLPS